MLPIFYASSHPFPFTPRTIKKEKNYKKINEKVKEEKKSNPNLHIEELDLSHNSLGYTGVQALSNALKINTTIKKLNLFHNLFDVDGARRIGELLKNNKTLEELDIGYNRIKNEGFKYIVKALKESKNLNLHSLGLKYNLINDKTLEEQMDLIEDEQNIKLEQIDLKNNSLTSGFLQKYWEEKFSKSKKKINIDIFDVVAHLSKDKLDRTVWIQNKEIPIKSDFLKEIERLEAQSINEEESHLGIPLFMRKKRGRKTGKKKDKECKNIFIEFVMPNSVNRMLKLSATSQFRIKGKPKKIIKAGTKPDYLLVKKRLIAKK